MINFCYIAEVIALMSFTVMQHVHINNQLYAICSQVNMTTRVVYIMIASVWIYGFTYSLAIGIPTTGIVNGICKR